MAHVPPFVACSSIDVAREKGPPAPIHTKPSGPPN